jgi:hypothetical protein
MSKVGLKRLSTTYENDIILFISDSIFSRMSKDFSRAWESAKSEKKYPGIQKSHIFAGK